MSAIATYVQKIPILLIIAVLFAQILSLAALAAIHQIV